MKNRVIVGIALILSMVIFGKLLVSSELSVNIQKTENDENNIIREGTEIIKNNLKNKNTNVLATVNEEPIYQYTIDNLRVSYELSKVTLTEEELLDRVIKHIVLKQSARKMGLYISDEVVDEYINQIRIDIKDTEENYAFYIMYLKGLEMTEDEYWELTREDYRNLLLVGELNNTIVSNAGDIDEFLKQEMKKAVIIKNN